MQGSAAARHGAGLRTLRGTVGYYGIDREGAEGACCCARCSTGILNHESMSASCAQPSKESYLNLSTHKDRPADLHAPGKSAEAAEANRRTGDHFSQAFPSAEGFSCNGRVDETRYSAQRSTSVMRANGPG